VRGTSGGEADIASKPGGWKPIVALVLCVAAFNYVWMPADFIEGDPTGWREETRSLLLHGELNVPAGYAQRIGEPGQYFVRNERTGLYYAKYGLANALFALPPMWLQQATGGDLSAAGRLPSLFLFNVWYVLLSAVLAGLLYALSGAYSTNVGSRLLYVAGVLYCTFMWFYQRAQSSELYQVILFIAFFMALTAFLRRLAAREPRGLESRAWSSLALVWVCAGLLILTRVSYGLLLPLVVLLCAYAVVRPAQPSGFPRAPHGLALALLVPPILIVVLLGAVNLAKFGAPWLTGYHAWHPEWHWPIGRIADGVWGFLFSSRFSIFLYFPLLAFALLGFPQFARQHRLDTVAMLTIFVTFLALIGKVPLWAGEWTYGPRYLLFILPIVSLPFLTLADRLIDKSHTWRARAVGLAVVLSLAYSAHLQVQVNRLPFFMYYNARGGVSSPESIEYFYEHHVGVIADDLLRHRDNLDALPFFPDLKRLRPPEYVAYYRAIMAGLIARGNLYWALPPEERR